MLLLVRIFSVSNIFDERTSFMLYSVYKVRSQYVGVCLLLYVTTPNS